MDGSRKRLISEAVGNVDLRRQPCEVGEPFLAPTPNRLGVRPLQPGIEDPRWGGAGAHGLRTRVGFASDMLVTRAGRWRVRVCGARGVVVKSGWALPRC